MTQQPPSTGTFVTTPSIVNSPAGGVIEDVSVAAGGGVVSSAGGVVVSVASFFGAQEMSRNAVTATRPRVKAIRFIDRVISLSFRGQGSFGYGSGCSIGRFPGDQRLETPCDRQNPGCPYRARFQDFAGEIAHLARGCMLHRIR